MDEDKSSDSSWSDDEEQVEAQVDETSTCLFCPDILPTYHETFQHIKAKHDLDILRECHSRKIDCVGYIKLINFVRKEKVEPGQVFTMESDWKDTDTYMAPAMEDDSLLQYDIEGQPDSMKTESEESLPGLQKKINEYTDKIHSLQSTVDSLRVSIKNIVDVREGKKDGSQKNVKHYENENYFSSYSHFGIHQEMLSDWVRTSSYQDGIIKNRNVFAGKSVLDIGCGTGILSLFSATAGAQQVMAVDDSDMAFYAMTIVAENKMNQQIEVVKRRVEELPHEKKFDIIVSEWMGYFLVFEGMLDTIIDARNNLLKPDGLIFPNRCTLTIAGVCDNEAYHKHVHFWDNVFGYKMSSLKHECMLEAVVTVEKAANLITEPVNIKHIDVMTCTVEETHTIETDFSMKCTRSGTVNAICGWFDCFFDAPALQEKVCLSTSPFTKETHWKQTVFLLQKPIELKEGDCLEGHVSVTRMKTNARALQIVFKFRNGESQEFFMN
ncbi:Protein arginine N-methyltransferase 3 [Halotydeus destructor]|nr:Protein arginine N-methyltransferase 3 [Halotydeus destructor]